MLEPREVKVSRGFLGGNGTERSLTYPVLTPVCTVKMPDLIITLDDTILMGYHSCDDQTLQMQRDEVDIQWPFLQEAAAEHTTDS